MPKKVDTEMAEFEAALLRSAKQAVDGKYARVHSPDEIVRRRGRPVGSTAAVRKSATTIRLDEEVLSAFKATGQGWQTRMNNALKDWLKTHQLT
ncbi:BrnA antitoxin family protein [Achromobacter pestifer]|uniref:BrnA antitoxin family protein n=1 Tax=Achromobacter pestifer TaxID=1353889 RepID=A0A7D4DWY2_9BURK|nr:BrnA antitoxin family protein [Achromobacter pestifer]QKH35372.1 BrnA antitoxin family protein [Achromobacter pestifer]